jgi:exodeoxyribonuclease X
MTIRIVDVETCGLPPNDAQIVEVATVDLVSSTEQPSCWTRGKMWSSLVNPGRPIPPEASAVHHITDEMVKDAPRIEALPNFLAGAEILCAHNMKFEREVLKLSVPAGLHGASWICSYKCGVLLYPDCPNHKNQTLRYYLGLKLADPSLATPHRALGDAYVTAALIRNFLRSATVDEMVEASAGPILLPRLTFGEHAMKPMAEVPWSYLDWIVNKSRGPWDEDVLYTAKHYLANPVQGAA